MTLNEQVAKAMNRLAKWRAVFTGWQLGTRPQLDAEAAAVRDHREATLFLRVELNALTRVLVDKKIITTEEFQRELLKECTAMQEMLEHRFPGFTAADYGMSIDVAVARETTKNWKP